MSATPKPPEGHESCPVAFPRAHGDLLLRGLLTARGRVIPTAGLLRLLVSAPRPLVHQCFDAVLGEPAREGVAAQVAGVPRGAPTLQWCAVECSPSGGPAP